MPALRLISVWLRRTELASIPTNFRDFTYATLLEEAATALRAGRGAIVDATFNRAADRLKAFAIAEKAKVPVLFIECVVSEGEAVRRLNARAERPGAEASDATVAVYEQQRGEFEAISEIPPKICFVIDTGREQELVASELDAALCSSGIEPFFALASVRRALDGRTMTEINRAAVKALEALGPRGVHAIDKILESGSLRAATEIPEKIRRRFPIALELNPLDHIRMQAAFQRHVDAAVSKTVNLPANASVDDARQVFEAARRFKLKGVTVYRYGSKARQALSLVHDEHAPDCRECAV